MPDPIALAAPVAPTAPNGAAPPAPAAPDPIKLAADAQAKADAAMRDVEKKERAHVQRVRKDAEERKTWGEKLSRLGELEKREQQAKTNPLAFLKGIYGDAWYDVATKAKLDGTPPADLIASELEKVRDEVKKEFTERDNARQKQEYESARQALRSDAHSFVSTAAKEYPVFDGYPAEHVASLLAQRVESEYGLALKRSEATGAPAVALTIKQAADLVEAEMLGIAEKVAGHEKYRAKLTAKLTPTPPAVPTTKRPETQQRRTLSNDLTGTTPIKAATVTDAERRKKAIDAFNAARKPQS